METLIAVAIVVILFGVAFIGVQNLVDGIHQTKLDNIAQSMYVSAQNRIRELRATGEIDRLLTATELGTVTAKPADWEDDPTDMVNYGDLRYFYHNKDITKTSTLSTLVAFIFPKGSIDEDVLDDNWVIELDPATGYVYSAFYSDTRPADDFYINDLSTPDQSVISSIRFKDSRHGIKGRDKVGYYGGKANMPADTSGYTIHARLNVINADILQARMTAVIPSVFDTSVLRFNLTITGKTSNHTVTLTPDVSTKNVETTKVFYATVVLDKLAAGQHFKDTFGDATWKPTGLVESRTDALIPGEDLDLSFTVSSSDTNVSDIGPKERTVNSLFASLNPAAPTEANIAYGRHLQNLDNTTSGLPAGAITAAKQISDIDFHDESDKDLLPAEEHFLWKTLYEDKTFTPINNLNLNIYSGYMAAPEPDSYKILNMHIANSANPAGLFGNFAGNEISGVTMVNEKIDGGTDVGGLAGTTDSDLTIKDCKLYIDKKYFASASTYADNILLNGTANVGGLVGRSTDADITIQDSFAATIIKGIDSIGGLIGSQTNGHAHIQDSYADSYLIAGASTSRIGGLAGHLAAGSSIAGSYSAGFGIKGDFAGDEIAAAAGFVPNGISSVTNSYALFDCSESTATHIYSTAQSAYTVTHVYYFGDGDKKLEGSLKYSFTSNAEAAAQFTGSKFSSDDNKNDTYPYNQKTNLKLVTYPYVSITGLPHYGDWKPEEPEGGKLILKYLNETGTYINNRYTYKNGDGGIDPNLISENTNISFSALNDEMRNKTPAITPAPVFEGWYVKDTVSGNHQKLLDVYGQIVNDIENITQNRQFNVHPAGDIELFAMWTISSNSLTLVNTTGQLPNTTATRKYLVLARVPRKGDAANLKYYCMTGISPVSNNPVTGTRVDLQQDVLGNYYLTSPVSNNTMLWDVVTNKNTKFFKLFNTSSTPYIKERNKNSNSDAVFCSATDGRDDPAYNHSMHNLYFSANWRILFDSTNNKFVFENSNQGVITTQDGGIWLFECETNPQERLHEFKLS